MDVLFSVGAGLKCPPVVPPGARFLCAQKSGKDAPKGCGPLESGEFKRPSRCSVSPLAASPNKRGALRSAAVPTKIEQLDFSTLRRLGLLNLGKGFHRGNPILVLWVSPWPISLDTFFVGTKKVSHPRSKNVSRQSVSASKGGHLRPAPTKTLWRSGLCLQKSCKIIHKTRFRCASAAWRKRAEPDRPAVRRPPRRPRKTWADHRWR